MCQLLVNITHLEEKKQSMLQKSNSINDYSEYITKGIYLIKVDQANMITACLLILLSNQLIVYKFIENIVVLK